MSSRRQTKALSPQERAVKKARERWRAGCKELGVRVSVNWEEYANAGNHFDGLSDKEWVDVWRHVFAASCERPPPNEARVREFVDDAAISSGWFLDYGTAHISRAHYRQSAQEKRRLLKKVQKFRNELAEFFGEPPCDHKEPYDPWGRYRRLIPFLGVLVNTVARDIARDEHRAQTVRDPANSAKPELDLWRARLVLVWRDECGLPVKNSKELRGFLLDSVRPYMPRAELTDRMAKHFLKRWLVGEVQDPGMSLFQGLKADFQGVEADK